MENFGVYIWLFMIMTLCKEYYSQFYIAVRFLTNSYEISILLKNANLLKK